MNSGLPNVANNRGKGRDPSRSTPIDHQKWIFANRQNHLAASFRLEFVVPEEVRPIARDALEDGMLPCDYRIDALRLLDAIIVTRNLDGQRLGERR